MASSFSTNSKLELITTGEKAGLWGTITNTNLQILEQLSTGYLSLAVGGADVALALDNGATSNGKNLYYKLTGTLAANRTVTLPDSTERVVIIEDATTRGSNNRTLTFKTASGNGVTIPVGSKSLLYSDGTNVNKGLINKGYYTVPGAYTAVDGDQLLVNTSSGGINSSVTITLPASPAIGNEVHFIDSGNFLASNNLTISRNGSNILGSASNLTVNVNGAAFTLVYVNAARGWAYKDKI